MDQADLKLLAALQENARQTADELADEIGLSPSSVQKRLKRLRADGIVEREVALLDQQKLGGFMFFMTHLQMVAGRPNALENTKEFARHQPAVLQCFHVTGSADLILLIATRNMAEFEAFSDRYFLKNDDIARYDTNVVIRTVKIGFALPLKEAE
jgi:Lrp/AsnC family leucine-responsive transcriptional regulator